MATPLRNFRLDDETWAELKESAERQGTDVSALIRRLINEHLGK